MKSALPCVLTVNGGSSGIRFAVYEAGETPRRRLDGKIDRIGLSGTVLIAIDPAGQPQVPRRFAAADHRTAGLIDAFRKRHPKLPQVACFDPAFHRTMPRVAKLLPIPRR